MVVLYHIIQVWLALAAVAGIWFAIEIQRAPRLEWHN